MMQRFYTILVASLLCLPIVIGTANADSQQDELRALKKTVEAMQKTIDEQNKKIREIEKAQHRESAAPAPVAATVRESVEQDSPVTGREALNDQQGPAPRADNLAIDPAGSGFIPIPGSSIIMKFNAKPRVDFLYDYDNSIDGARFTTSSIPVSGDSNEGDGPHFAADARGSQLSIDARAPTIAGNPRFYFQNDFFGSGSAQLNFRVQHLYGTFRNVTIGQTYGVFEDPDVWPDTVDYGGPNAIISTRVPLVHYKYRFANPWTLTLGLEQPQSKPSDYFGAAVNPINHAPDGGFNLRWEEDDVGHTQFSVIARSIGARSATLGEHSTLGWGASFSGVLDFFDGDSLLGQATYGQGIGALGNDTSSSDTDAAFDRHDNLIAIPYVGAYAGYTHRWTTAWRSTASYGFVNMDPQASQGSGAFRRTHYSSLNLIWQMQRHLSLGLETLYGHNETQDGAEGEVVRTQVGFLYSIF